MIHLLRLYNWPIYKQLQLEEALLRTDDRNWCLINTGSPEAIVMGISGKKEDLIEERTLPMPVIRRFSGGGCVLIDEETLFITLIYNRHSVSVAPFPQHIMQWSGEFYQPLFPDKKFSVRENDYVLDDRKFGGNAQYILKNRWLHHSSLLWDFCPEKMSVLKLPSKRPEYRNNRDHGDFLCTLKPHFSSKEDFLNQFQNSLSRKFNVMPIREEEALDTLNNPHRKGTQFAC